MGSRQPPLDFATLVSASGRLHHWTGVYLAKFRRSGGVHFFSAQIFSQFLSFGSSLLVVRFLSPGDLGESRVIATYNNYLLLLGGLGLTAGVVVYFPRERDPEAKLRWFNTMALVSVAFTALLGVLAGLASAGGHLMAHPGTAYWFRWSIIGAVANSSVAMLTAYYQAEREIKKLSGVQSVVRCFNVALIVVLAWAFGFPGYVVAVAAGSCAAAASLFRASRWRWLFARLRDLPPGLWSLALFAFGATVICQIGRSMDMLMLDRMAHDRPLLGCFALATSLLLLPGLFTSTIQQVANPYFAPHHGDRHWLVSTAIKTQVIATLGSFVLAVAVYTGTMVLLRWVYTPAYRPTEFLMLPMLAAYVLNSSYHLLSSALFAAGLTRVNFQVSVLMLPVSLGCSYFGIRSHGVAGAAWAQFANAAFYALLQHALGWRALLRLPAGPGGNGPATTPA